MTQKKVSLPWQIASAIFLPMGLYGFKRINKLKLGIVVYVIAYSLTITGGFVEASSDYSWGLPVLQASIFSFVLYAIGVMIPLYFMGKWSKEWNEVIDNQKS